MPVLADPQLSESLVGFDYVPRTRVVFGEGVVDQLGKLAAELGGTRVLLVTDKGLAKAGHEKHGQNALESAGLKVTVFDDVHSNPSTIDVDHCVRVARDAKVDLIVGLGGGSSMDCAKGCNFLLTNGGRMEDYWGVGKASK
ncbi:MAG: iron-containing alcohol dehydrogenase, partial [Planctomycetaceae bacterium]|nr:iron-containing alcohol dehydrogenase [Planctomycetaceae bacterium]